MLVHYKSHLVATGFSPEDADTFRFNSITRKYYISFVTHPDDITLISATSDMNTTPPTNSGLVENSKVAYSSANSFKSLLKDIQVFLLLLRKGSLWILVTGRPSLLSDHRM